MSRVLSCVPFNHARGLVSNRSRGEDRVEVFDRGNEVVVVVADGAGGLSGGAAAADVLVDAVQSAVSDSGQFLDENAIVGLLREVDAELASLVIGETTGVVIVLAADTIVGASVGDSEAWIVEKNAVIDDLTATQKRYRLGSGRASPMTFRRGGLRGSLVVGTDGLFKYAPVARITELATVGDESAAADALVQLPRLPSGAFPDDVGVVVLRCLLH